MEKTGDAPLLLTLSSKRCPCCDEVKPTTEFTRNKEKNGKLGFYCYCKECANKKHKKYRIDNPENSKRAHRKSKLKRLYGLTIEDVEIMLKNQNSRCAICGRELFLHGTSADKNKIARVDHNHETGEVRGLLCDKCNRGLGYFDDNEEYLIKAASYLKKTK